MSNSLSQVGFLRSYVRREGRITVAQRRAMDDLWSCYGLSASDAFEHQCFARRQPLVLEIGFGMGQSLLQMAAANPHENYLGVEVYRPGVGAALLESSRQALDNIKFYNEDVVAVCTHALPLQCLHRVQVFFPDPWPKKRHHKRRLIQPPFVQLLSARLEVGGVLHLATDVDSYAEHMRAVMGSQANLQPVTVLADLPYQRPHTKFEAAGLAKGHCIHDLVYQVV